MAAKPYIVQTADVPFHLGIVGVFFERDERAQAPDVPLYMHPATQQTLPLSAEDEEKLLNGNARRLLRL